MSGRAAWELGERLAAAGDLTEPELIRHMTLEHVEAVATKRAVVVPALVTSHDHDFGAPLPAWFQLSDLGRPILRSVPPRWAAIAPGLGQPRPHRRGEARRLHVYEIEADTLVIHTFIWRVDDWGLTAVRRFPRGREPLAVDPVS